MQTGSLPEMKSFHRFRGIFDQEYTTHVKNVKLKYQAKNFEYLKLNTQDRRNIISG